jgi:TolB-like protein
VKNSDILDSWKDISDYLERDVRTCRRWEAELGLPVNRINADSTHSKVFAYKSEIDQWFKDRANNNKTPKQYILVNRWIFIGIAILFIFLISSITLIMSDNLKSLLSRDQPSLAVFPFVSTHHGGDEWDFSQSVMTGMIRNISSAGKINVIPVSAYAGSDGAGEKQFPYRTAQNLGADYMLVGKVENEGDRFLIGVQLIRTKDQKKVWEEKCGGEWEEVLAAQNLLCAKLHEKLSLSK